VKEARFRVRIRIILMEAVPVFERSTTLESRMAILLKLRDKILVTEKHLFTFAAHKHAGAHESASRKLKRSRDELNRWAVLWGFNRLAGAILPWSRAEKGDGTAWDSVSTCRGSPQCG